MGRINEIRCCNNISPEEGLESLIDSYAGDYGHYEPVTEKSLDAHWEEQDRWDVTDLVTKEKLRTSVKEGKPWFWFSIHE